MPGTTPGSASLLMLFNPTTGKFEPGRIDDATKGLLIDAAVSVTLGSLRVLPDQAHQTYDFAAGAGAASQPLACKTDMEADFGGAPVVPSGLSVLLEDTALAPGAQAGTVVITTSAGTGNAIPLYNDRERVIDGEAQSAVVVRTNLATCALRALASGYKAT